MLLSRFAPIGSPRFKKLSENSTKFDKIINWLPVQLFGVWTVFVAGMSAGKGQIDRYYFWDWSDWLIGIVGILFITLMIKIFANKFYKASFEKKKEPNGIFVYNIIMPLIIFYIGYILFAGLNNIFNVAIYPLFYCAIFLIHTISNDAKPNIIVNDSKKYLKTVISILLLVITVIIGAIIDDPLITTASVVSLPFLFVLLFGKHIRHLKRARFYPVFIFAMFVSSREAWFLIPLFLLFHILRSYNYLQNQKVYPTFGVDIDNN